jgi:hypothetical protein
LSSKIIAFEWHGAWQTCVRIRDAPFGGASIHDARQLANL